MRNVNVKASVIGFNISAGFILTMRNVNLYKGDENKIFDVSFILTMRNVNVSASVHAFDTETGFILTMRNVNIQYLFILSVNS